VHGIESPDRLDKNLPNLPLLDIGSVLLMFENLLKHVSIFTELSNDTAELEITYHKELLRWSIKASRY
jgi:hypothetical protein